MHTPFAWNADTLRLNPNSPDPDGVAHLVGDEAVPNVIASLPVLNSSAVSEMSGSRYLFATYPGNGRVHPELLCPLGFYYQKAISTGHMSDDILPPKGE